MPLPGEELVWESPLASEVAMDRRLSRDGGSSPFSDAASRELPIDRRLVPRAPRVSWDRGGELEDASGGEEETGSPLSEVEARLAAAIRSVSEGVQRRLTFSDALLARARTHISDGEVDLAFDMLGQCLLARPLDPAPVRELEDLAARHGKQGALAALYERLLAENPDHPSGEVLSRRIVALQEASLPGQGAADSEGSSTVLDGVKAETEFSLQGPGPASVVRPPLELDEVADSTEPPLGEVAARVSPSADIRRAPLGLRVEPLLGERPSRGPELDSILRAPLELGEPSVGSVEPLLGEIPSRGPESDRILRAPLDLGDGSVGSSEPLLGDVPSRGPGSDIVLRAALELDDGPVGSEERVQVERPLRRSVSSGESQRVPVSRRASAWLVDVAVLVAMTVAILAAGLSAVGSGEAGAAGASLHRASPSIPMVLGSLCAFVYLTLCWGLGGKTLGESVAGLRSIDTLSGGTPRIGRAALRAALAILGTLMFLVGPLWALVDRNGRTLHDMIAGTATVRG
ncbi:RDD family protein [Vulgatibacter incomptus]|nr:RDD family protein [Vulgatibacter incomptus]